MADPELVVRVADERDAAALAALRRAWLEERAGHPVDDPGFEAAFGLWWSRERPRRTFWLAETGSAGDGWTPIGSINVVEIGQMPRPGARAGRTGQVGGAFVLGAFADREVAAALLARAVDHARQRRYNRLLLSPTDASASFYRQAGFGPAGESLLVLDPTS